MRLQATKQMLRLQEWSEQIKARNASGLSVKQWCKENGINEKTYYMRQKRVQEELLEKLTQQPELMQTGQQKQIIPQEGRPCPEIVAIPAMQLISESRRETNSQPYITNLYHEQAAITIYIGSHVIEIKNNADEKIVEQVLKAVSRI